VKLNESRETSLSFTLYLCELSEGLAFKYLNTCHLNQAHRQYVDSNALAFIFLYLLPAATPLLCSCDYTSLPGTSQAV
jgi:hypothetical protein